MAINRVLPPTKIHVLLPHRTSKLIYIDSFRKKYSLGNYIHWSISFIYAIEVKFWTSFLSCAIIAFSTSTICWLFNKHRLKKYFNFSWFNFLLNDDVKSFFYHQLYICEVTARTSEREKWREWKDKNESACAIIESVPAAEESERATGRKNKV